MSILTRVWTVIYYTYGLANSEEVTLILLQIYHLRFSVPSQSGQLIQPLCL